MIKRLSIFSSVTFLILSPILTFGNSKPAVTAPIPLTELKDFSKYDSATKKLILAATELSKQNLTYLYASADPKNHGLDCSGTIYYLLTSQHVKDVPRQSSDMYVWAKKYGHMHETKASALSSSQFTELKPGDLLFWSGTYNIKHNPPITHVMLYLGKNKKNQPLMFGASDGRPYQHKKMWGVSVFDLLLPNASSRAKFEGYSCIPQLNCR